MPVTWPKVDEEQHEVSMLKGIFVAICMIGRKEVTTMNANFAVLIIGAGR